MHPLEMSGLELLRAAASGQLPRASLGETIPMSFAKVDAGYVKMTARASSQHLNPLGGVHGGFTATVLDSVTGCAVHSMLEPGVGYGTIDLQVKMLRPVPRDQDVVAEGRTVTLSTSAEYTFSPPVTIMSFVRSTMNR